MNHSKTKVKRGKADPSPVDAVGSQAKRFLPPVDTPWMSPREAAAYLRISPTTLYNWVTEHGLPNHAVMGKTLYNKGELDRWVTDLDKRSG
jgi:excisionase family DNA binding protein